MFVVNPSWVYQQTVTDAFLAGLDTVPIAALMLTPTVRLYTNAHIPNPRADTPADFTQATFAGYAGSALVLDDPVNNGTSGRCRHAEANFVLGSPAAGGEVIQGCYITNAASTVLYGQAPFTNPVSLAITGDELSLDIVLPLAFRQDVEQ